MGSDILGKLVFLGCLFLIPVAASLSQDVEQPDEIQSFLRRASAEIPKIRNDRQFIVASDIAGLQARAGDLAGAVATARAVSNQWGRAEAVGSVADGLAWRGDATSALRLIKDASAGDLSVIGTAIDRDYSAVAATVASRHDFEGALKIVRLIEKSPANSFKANLILNTLIRIRFKQWQSGDQNGAQETLNLALQVVDRERQHPSDPELATSTPAGMYGTIANELVREGNREAALQILDRDYGLVAEAPTPKQKQDTLFQSAYWLAGIGEIQPAEDLTQQLEDTQQRENVRKLIASQKIKQGDPFAVVPEALSLTYEPWKNVSLRQIADRLAATGNYTLAISAVEQIENAGERAYGFSQLAFEQAESGSPSAPLFVELAWEAALNGGSETKPDVFGQIALAKAILGDFAGALEIVPRIELEDRGWVVHNLCATLIHAGKQTEAIAFAESQDTAEPRASAFLGIASEMFEEQRARAEKTSEQGGR